MLVSPRTRGNGRKGISRSAAVKLLGVGAVAACCVAGIAGAAATHVAPAPGAVLRTSLPTFRWTLPANEQSAAIYVANSGARDAQGRLSRTHIVDGEIFGEDVRRWVPNAPLHAGPYWWNVGSINKQTHAVFYSTPTNFSVAALLRVAKPVVRLRARHLDFRLAWRTNVPQLTIRIRLTSGRFLIWSFHTTFRPKVGPGYKRLSWSRRKGVPRGTPLKLVLTVSGSGRHYVTTRSFRAP